MFHVAASVPAWMVRCGGCLVVGVLAVWGLVTDTTSDGPLAVALFVLFAFGFTAVTGRSVAATAAALTVGGGAGVLAAVVPGLVFMLRPPIPLSSGWAFAVVVGAGVVAAGAVGVRPGGVRRWEMALSGLLAGAVAALLIWLVVVVMAQYGPESWVPPIVSHALTPAERLAERREFAGEPYLSVLLVGVVSALTLGVLSLRYSRVRTRPSNAPVETPGQIELGEV